MIRLKLQVFGLLLIIVFAASVLSEAGFVRGPKSLGFPVTATQGPVSAQYITTFPLSQTCGTTFGPWVLSPSTDNGTVWLDAFSPGNQTLSQIISFTINPAPGQPQCHDLTTLRNAIPQSIAYDRNSRRVWFTYNDTLAFLNPNGTATKAITFAGGSPEYIAIDQQDNIWITLVAANQVVEYVPATNRTLTISTFSRSSVLQGITIAPDGKVWFAEPGAKKLGSVVPCSLPSCPSQELSPPAGIVLYAPIQVAVDPDGVVWFTDHGSNQFGSYNPATNAWRLYPVGYCKNDYCSNVLPNAIWYSNGKIWFSEHIAGRISSFDKATGLLTEYIIPSNGDTPLSWWAAPGINNLVWFASYSFGEIGYVNASIPTSIGVSATTSGISVKQGGSEAVQVTTHSQGTFSLGVSPMTTDDPFFSASTTLSHLTPAQGLLTSILTISAAWNSTLGSRYLALTAFNGQIAVSTYLAAVVVETPLPYVTLLFALAISVGAFATYVRRPKREKLRSGKQLRK